MYSIVIRYLFNLQSDSPDNSSTYLAPYITIYYSIIDYIPYAVLHIPVTIL